MTSSRPRRREDGKGAGRARGHAALIGGAAAGGRGHARHSEIGARGGGAAAAVRQPPGAGAARALPRGSSCRPLPCTTAAAAERGWFGAGSTGKGAAACTHPARPRAQNSWAARGSLGLAVTQHRAAAAQKSSAQSASLQLHESQTQLPPVLGFKASNLEAETPAEAVQISPVSSRPPVLAEMLTARQYG